MKQKFDTRYINVLARIRGKIVLSRIAIWLEGVSRSFWPLTTLVLFAYAFASFDGFALLSQRNTFVITGVFIVAAIVLFAFGLRKFRVPSGNMILERLDDGQEGRPLASLRDQTATGGNDALTNALWEHHQERMVAEALNVRITAPDLRLASRDRSGLRLMALVMAFMAIVFAPRNVVETIQNALVPPNETTALSISFEAWANPPVYTGKPAVYLSDVTDKSQLLLPVGSEIVVRVYGLVDGARIEETVSGGAILLEGDQQGLKSANFIATQPGVVRLLDGEDVLGVWEMSIEQDLPPTITLTEDPSRNASGFMQLAFEASDDYGVASGSAVIRLDLASVDRRFGLAADPVALEAVTLELPMPFTRDRTEVIETLIEDLNEHLWANLPVTIDLTVIDDAGQEGRTSITTELPARRFYVPLAAAFAEQRRDLLWSAENDPRILPILKAATFLPEDLGLSASSYLMVRTVIRRLGYMMADGLVDDERAEITDLMWEVANRLEDGDLSDARERLRRAQERLARALEQDADEAELEQLMEELQEATDDFMQALADEARENGEMQQADSGNPTISQDQLQEMMDELQRLMENGENEEAQEMLQALQELLENLQMAQQQGQGEGDGEAGEQMQEMQDALNQQQELSDETFRELQESLGQGSEPQSREELAERQEALRELLENMQQDGAGREQMEEAERNMAEARDRLEDGDAGGALDQQAEAMENLREGIRELAEEMQSAAEDGNGQAPGAERATEVDPLGRALGDGGRTTTGDQILPGDSAVDRARELLDEIRRRSGEGGRPEIELEYLERLLDRF